MDEQKLDDVLIENALVIYRGGPIKGRGVTLKNCVLIFETRGIPPPPGQKYIDDLLASTELSEVVVKG